MNSDELFLGLHLSYIKSIRENITKIPSPALEDLFHEIRVELMFRDKKVIDETL